MKFRLKITICMVWLLALAFGIGGSLLIALNFSGSFQREIDSALSSYRMVLGTLRLVDDVGPMPDHSNLSQALAQMNSQDDAGWSALRLGDGDSVIYEDNPLFLDLVDTVQPL